MKRLVIILVLILGLTAYLNTFYVSDQTIKAHWWKYYDGYSPVFKDVISFKNGNVSLKEDGSIYINKSLYLGKIIKRHHNYVNTIITVLDSSGHEAQYIAK